MVKIRKSEIRMSKTETNTNDKTRKFKTMLILQDRFYILLEMRLNGEAKQ